MLSIPALPPHVYLHVPFCASKCGYCDFFSVADAPGDVVDAWLAAVVAQTREWVGLGLPGTVETVYIGGGTPSWSEAPVPLVAGGEEETTLPLAEGAEVTMEANPDSFDEEAVARARDLLVNRVSIGVQSFDDAELIVLGRRHDARQAQRTIERALSHGFRVSVDLMCGLPGQALASWERTLSRALSTGVRHVSVYPLSLEPGTPLALEIERGAVTEPDPDVAAEMMLAADEVLRASGLPRYEVASYAVPGHESRHNLAYWMGRPYVGLGPGAHGMLDAATARAAGLLGGGASKGGKAGEREAPAADRAAGAAATDRVRYAYAPDLPGPARIADAEVELLDTARAGREDVMLGLRLVAGVPASDVEEAGLAAVLERLAEQGLCELSGERWRTTRRGWLLGNEVYGAVWAGE